MSGHIVKTVYLQKSKPFTFRNTENIVVLDGQDHVADLEEFHAYGVLHVADLLWSAMLCFMAVECYVVPVRALHLQVSTSLAAVDPDPRS